MITQGLREHVVATITNATSQDVITERVGEGKRWIIERIAVRDRTTACTRIEVLISRGGDEYSVADQSTPQANRIYWTTDRLTLYDGEYLICRVVGATAADIVDVWVVGQEEVP